MKHHRYRPGKQCPNNGEVYCPDNSKCDRCGWNPEIASKRLEAIKKELQQKRSAEK